MVIKMIIFRRATACLLLVPIIPTLSLAQEKVPVKEELVLEEVIVTDTIPLDSKKEECSKLKVLSISDLLAEAIKRIHDESSISSLFV